MAGRQRHVGHIGHVPGRNDQAAGIGIVFDLIDQAGDLVNGFPIGPAP